MSRQMANARSAVTALTVVTATSTWRDGAMPCACSVVAW